MTRYVSMLRGVNVGGKSMSMAKLADMCRSLGFEQVRTYIQSGNVVFEHPAAEPSKVRDELEREIERSFGFEVMVIVRTKDEMERVVKASPFAHKDPAKVYVTFLRDGAASFPTDEVSRFKGPGDEFSSSGREVHLYVPNGYGRTKLSNSLLERKLKVAATTRNWTTVTTLLSMASG